MVHPKHSSDQEKELRTLEKVLLEGDRSELQECIINLVSQSDAARGADLQSLIHEKSERLDNPHSESEHIDYAHPLGIGTYCGPFRIEKVLAQGGMGTVYLAARQDDIEIKVALKTLNSWQPKLLDRFRKECKILSGLTHSGIAHVIDAGVLNNGQPWLAMEYVAGHTLSEYLTQFTPSLAQLLRLFLKICDALSYAHQQLVIHRDIKPSNIMISPNGDPKLLDFGIAALMNSDTQSPKTVTAAAERLMTPEYASPEQINGENVKPVSDVYSMGIILYEMLTGKRPYTFSSVSLSEIAETINQADITPPSMLPSLTHGPNAKQLRGDLDTIVLKTLEKEPDQRYHSVEALAGDIKRYLMGLPISARPVTRIYRLRKFISRNPWPVAMASGVIVFLISFALYAQMQRTKITLERDIADRERQTSESMTHFLISLFEQMDPDLARGGEVSAYELMENGRLQLQQSLKDAPQVRARLMITMGKVYRNLGHLDQSQELLESALQTHLSTDEKWTTQCQLINTLIQAGNLAKAQELLDVLSASQDQMDTNTAAMLHFLKGRIWQTRGNPNKAIQHLNRALSLPLPIELELAFSKARIQVNEELGFYEKCIKGTERQLKMERQVYGEQHSTIAESLIYLAQYHMNMGALEKAQQYLDDSRTMLIQIFGDVHPRLILLYQELSHLKLYTMELEASEAFLRKALSLSEKLLGKEHVITAKCLHQLALIKTFMGDYQSAEFHMRESITMKTAIFGESNLEVGKSLALLGNMLKQKGELEAARNVGEQALVIFNQKYDGIHSATADALFELASTYQVMGNYQQATPLLERAIKIYREVMGPENPKLGPPLLALGQVFQGQGFLEKAEQYYLETQDLLNHAYGEGNPQVSGAINSLANLFWVKGNYQSALPYYRKALALNEAALGRRHYFVAINMHNVALPLIVLGKWDEAEKHLNEALTIMSETMGTEHYFTGKMLKALAELNMEKGLYSAADKYIGKALANLNATRNENPSDWFAALEVESRILLHQGRLREAEEKLEQLQKMEGLGFDTITDIMIDINLTQVWIYQGHYQKADVKLIEATRKAANMNDPLYGRLVQYNQVTLYHHMGQYEKARAILEKLISAMRAQKGEQHPTNAVFKIKLASILLVLGQPEETPSLLQESKSILVQSLPQQHELHAYRDAIEGQYKCLTGEAVGSQQLKAAYTKLTRRLGPNHFLTKHIQGQMASCRDQLAE